MDSAPMTMYRGKGKGFAGAVKAAAQRAVTKKRQVAFKKSYQAPAVGGSSFTGPGSAGGGIGG